mmetsp:Transcript_95860/g.241501  ORF Transcript_95860/g.241501 Transcript_95860/m.241501 type:complete len:203 (-) Transcript_95860:272-880(-)
MTVALAVRTRRHYGCIVNAPGVARLANWRTWRAGGATGIALGAALAPELLAKLVRLLLRGLLLLAALLRAALDFLLMLLDFLCHLAVVLASLGAALGHPSALCHAFLHQGLLQAALVLCGGVGLLPLHIADLRLYLLEALACLSALVDKRGLPVLHGPLQIALQGSPLRVEELLIIAPGTLCDGLLLLVSCAHPLRDALLLW